MFREFVRLCRELGLYGRELVAVDGTRIKAVNNRDRNFTRTKLQRHLRSIEERLERHLEQMNEADAQDADGSAHNRAACRSCTLRDRCTKSAYRRIARYEMGPPRPPPSPLMTSGAGSAK